MFVVCCGIGLFSWTMNMCGIMLVLAVEEVSRASLKVDAILTWCGQGILWPVFFSTISTWGCWALVVWATSGCCLLVHGAFFCIPALLLGVFYCLL